MASDSHCVRKILQNPYTFLMRVLRGFRANQGLLLSGAVAYYALLSIVPLFTLLLVIFAHFIDEQRLLTGLATHLELIIPGNSRAVVDQIAAFLKHRELAGWVLIGVLLFFSSVAFTVLENAMSVIFFHRVAIQRRHFLVSALLPYFFVTLLGLGFLLVMLVAGALQTFEGQQLQFLGTRWSLGQFPGAVLYLMGLAGLVLMYTSLYLVMPVGQLSLRHALIGGVTATILWELARHLLVWYFSTLSFVSLVYGSLATVIVMLISLEVGGIILLLGAQVIAEFERYKDEETGKRPLEGWQTE